MMLSAALDPRWHDLFSPTPWHVAAFLCLLLAAVMVFFLVRLRSVAGQIGAFECAWKPRHSPRWFSGVAVFTDDSLHWYRLVSLSAGPAKVWDRERLEVGAFRRRSEASSVVEVTCILGERTFDLAMHEDSHAALVAWVESQAPRQATLF